MTKTLSSILAVLILLALGTFGLKAQELGNRSFEAYEPDPLTEREILSASVEDPTDPTDPPRSQNNNSALQKDSVANTPTIYRNVYKPSPVIPKAETKSESADDSILSFNFLYYLIQKYKMQDIID
jgi:hypothetical protein